MDAAALAAAASADPLFQSPALVVDLDAVAHNVAAMVRRVGEVARWRPHLKTAKQSAVIEVFLDAGVRHFKVATLQELVLCLDTARARSVEVDVLLAYPQHADASLRSFDALAAAHPKARLHLLADSPDHLRRLGSNPRRNLMLDVDLGMARTGSPPATWAQALAEGLLANAASTLTGLHGYDGHRRFAERDFAHQGYDELCSLAAHTQEGLGAEAGGAPILDLITSGTHSYAHALEHPGLAEGPWRAQVSPGTIVFSDLRSADAAADLDLQQAAFVVARVVSLGERRVTLDAGSKAITPDGTPPTSSVVDHPELVPQRASEEHLPCQLSPGASPPELGSLVVLVPDHVCTTVNLHREALLLRGGVLVGRRPIEASGHWPRVPEASPAP